MRIGFTGHRPNRLRIGAEQLRVRVEEALSFLRSEAQARNEARPFIAVSALAEGSDRIFAECALGLGFVLEALLPMPRAEYLQTFEDKTAAPDFHALLARSILVRELPGSITDSKAAYEWLGQTMVAECDSLVAAWDGKPAAGRGGTPEVIDYALSKRRRVIWVDADSDRAPVQLKSTTPAVETLPLRP